MATRLTKAAKAEADKAVLDAFRADQRRVLFSSFSDAARYILESHELVDMEIRFFERMRDNVSGEEDSINFISTDRQGRFCQFTGSTYAHHPQPITITYLASEWGNDAPALIRNEENGSCPAP